MEVYRQGDVCFVPITEAQYKEAINPARRWNKAVQTTSSIIRKGEHGGQHQFEKMDNVELFNTGIGRKYAKTEAPVNIVHKEHGTVELPGGFWEIRIQQDSQRKAVMD